MDIKRIIESYLGITPAKPGESTAWSLEHQSPWPAIPEWMVLVLAVAFVATILFVHHRDAARVSMRVRASLIILRLLSIVAVLAFLARPVLQIDRTDLPYIVVLVDDSKSMSLPDQYSSDVESTIRDWLGQSRMTDVTRIDVARAILTADDGAFLKELVRNHKLRVYRFSETTKLVGDEQYLSGTDVGSLIGELHKLKAEGKDTRIQPSVKSVLDDFSGTPPTAIVILTDGVASISSSERLSAVIPLARRRLVPIYAVGIGSDKPTRDLQLYDLMVDEVAIIDVPLIFSAKLKSTGFAGQPVRVTLTKKGSPEVLAESTVNAPANGEPLDVDLSFTPEEEGTSEFVVKAEPLPGESNRSNNQDSREVTVRKGKIRVLLVDHEPRYEFRYIKHLLERETKERKTIEVDSLLQQQPKAFAQDENTIKAFPQSKDDLFKYDVVIFGDVDLKSLGSGADHLPAFVSEKGGGVVFIAGPQFNPLAYQKTPLEKMFPIVLESARLPAMRDSIVIGYRPELTAEGRRGTPLFRFAENQNESDQVFRRLPEFYWLLEAPQLIPGATVLAHHPSLKAETGRLPVIAMRRFGSGKVLFHATDELWRWRFRVGDTYFGRYWLQAVRFLSRSKLLGKDRTAAIDTDREKYEAGDDATIRVQFFRESLAPPEDGGVSVVVERSGDVARTIQLSRIPGSLSQFEGRLTKLLEGRYHGWISAPQFDDSPPSINFRVEAPSRELKQRDLDQQDLLAATRQTHGRYFSVANAMDLPATIPEGQPVSLGTQKSITLWDRWEFLLLFAVLMLAEWLLRKRARLA